jgi:hypothetical protein
LPNDDAGREYLRELLLPISLGLSPARIMANIIEVQAPWMSGTEGKTLIEEIQRIPKRNRTPSGKALGKRLNLTNAERERLRLWTIHPVDMNAAQMAAQRKAKHRARMQRNRQEDGAAPRKKWLATSLSKQKPWKAEGISRATWYRREALRQVRAPSCETETGPCEINS